MTLESQVQAYFDRLEANPNDMGALAQIERLYGTSEQWGELVTLLHGQAQEAGTPAVVARLLFESGRVAASRLGDADLASQLLNMAYEAGQQTALAYEVQLLAFALQQQWQELQEFFEQAVAAMTTPQDQSRMYALLATVLSDMVGDLDQADELYTYALQLDEQNVAAMWRRQALAVKSEAWERAAELLYAELEATQEAERQIELMLDLGDLYAVRLGQPDAARQCYQNVFDYNQADQRARAGLEALGVELEPLADEDAGAVEPEGYGIEELAAGAEQDMSDVEQPISAGFSEEEATAVGELEEIAPATDEQPDPQMFADEDATQIGSVEDIVREDAAPAEPEGYGIEELAAGAEQDMSDVEQPISAGFSEEEATAVGELEEIAPATDEQPDPQMFADDEATVVGGVEDVIEPEVEPEVSEEVAEEAPEVEEAPVIEEVIEEPEEEFEEFIEEPPVVDDLGPDVDEVEQVSWAELVADELAGFDALEDQDARRASLFTMATLEWINRDGDDTTLAQQIWGKAFEQGLASYMYDTFYFRYQGGDFWGSVLEQAEANQEMPDLLAKIALFSLRDQDRARQIATEAGLDEYTQLLDDTAAAQDNWRKYQRAVEQRYPDLDRDERNGVVFAQMAQMAEVLGDTDKLFDALRRLDRISPDPTIKGRMQLMYKATDKWPAYVDLVKQEAERLGDEFVTARVALWREAIRVYTTLMRNDMQAIALYKLVLEAVPGHEPSLTELIGLYERNNRTTEQIGLLQSKVELTESKRQKVAILSDVATLYLEKFRNQAEAIKAYEAILEIAPHHPASLQFLKENYGKRREWEKLIDVYKREIETLEGREARLAAFKEVAQIASEKMRDPDPSIELWLEALKRDPRDADALGSLEALYEKKRDYEALAGVLERRVKLVDDPAEKMKVFQKLGMLLVDRVQDPVRAIAAWEGALALNSDDLKARKSLERLYVDNQQWDKLEALYAQKEAWSELVRLLESLVGSAAEDDVKVELLLRSARVWRDRIGDLTRAERSLDRIHQQIDGENEAAAHELVGIYEATQNLAGLDKAYQIILGHRQDLDERRELQLQLARLHRDRIQDPEVAFSWFGQIFSEQPRRLDDTAALEELAGPIDAWFSVVDLYRNALELEGLEDEYRVELRMKLGRVLADEMESLDEALEQYNAILTDHADHTRAMGAMARIYERQGRWDELIEIYQRRLALVETVAERIEILHGTARIAEVQAGDKERALGTYLEAYELDPKHEPTLAELHRLYAEGERWEDLADIIRQEIAIVDGRGTERGRLNEHQGPVALATLLPIDGDEWEQNQVSSPSVDAIEETLAGDPESAAQEVADRAIARYTEEELEQLVLLNFELGGIAKHHLGKTGEALETLGRVLVARPSHREALVEIEDYLRADDDAVCRVAADVVEPVYEVYGRWADLIGAVEIQIATTADTGARAALYERVGDLYLEELGMAGESFAAYSEQLRLVPDNDRCRGQLELVADALGTWGDLISLHEEILPTIEDRPELATDYQFTLARMNAEHAGDPEKACQAFYSVLQIKEDSHQALDGLEALFIKNSQWQDMTDVYDRQLALASGDADTVRQIKFKIANLWEENLSNGQEAIDTITSVLDEHPEDLEAIESLNRLYRAESQWEELASNRKRQLELVEDHEKPFVKLALGEVYEMELGEPDTAVDIYEQLLIENRDNEEAVYSLERMMDAPDGTPAERISHILEPWFTERAEWHKLIKTLEVQARVTGAVPERIELLHRVAQLWENQLGELVEAMTVYSRAFIEDIENKETSANLYRIAEQSLAWDSLVEVLEQAVEQSDDPQTKRELLRQAASIYVDHLGDVESTAARLHDVIDIVPDDLESIDDLENIYRHLQEWTRLVDILKIKADVVDDTDEKKSLLYQAGTIYEEVTEEHELAIDVYNVILGVDPVDAHSIDRLEVLYQQLERWVDLLEVYNKKFELAENDEARKDLLYVIGSIHQNELDEKVEAIDVYRRVLDIDPQELGALEKLDELYEQTEQWNELLEVLEREIELAQIPSDRNTLSWRVGKLWEEHLGDSLRAVEVYAGVLEQDPAHEATLDALADLVERDESAVEAAQVLQPIYEISEQWEALVHIKRLLLAASNDFDRQLELLREIAIIHETRLGDGGSAFQALAEALRVSPGNEELLDELERLADVLYAWDPYIDLLDELIESTSDFVAANVMQLRVARVYEAHIGDAGAAIDRYVRVLEQDPVDEHALPALDRLYQQEARWEDLDEVLTTRIEQTVEPAERLEFRVRQGLVRREALENVMGALDVYREILADEPGEPNAIQALEEMFMAGQATEQIAEILEPFYLSRDEHQKLIDLYSARLHSLTDPDERHQFFMQIARIYTEEMGQEVNAMEPLAGALFEVPGDEGVIEELERIARAHGQWPQLAQSFMTVLEEREPIDEDAQRLWLHLAKAIDVELQMPSDAETAYLNVLALDPGHPEALEALDRIYLETQAWSDLAGILERRVVEVYDDDQLVELNTRLAKVYRDQLAEPERSIERFRSVLDIDPVNLEALESLESLFLAVQDFESLYRNLQSQADVATDPDRQADLFSQMSTIAEDMLGRREDAVDLLNRVIDLQPNNRDALGRLRRLYLADERWEDVVNVVTSEIDLSTDPEEQLGLYENLGVIWGERLDDEMRSLEAWQSALNIDPNYLPALEAMRDLHGRRSDYFELSNTLEKMLAHAELSDERKLELWIEQADIQGDMLMQPEDAIVAWNNVMLLDPGNALAMENLERLYIQEEHWEDAVTILDAKLDRLETDEQKLETGRQIAEILEIRILDRDRAAQYHDYILELDPTDEDAYLALEQTYTDQATIESYTALVNLYLVRAEIVGDNLDERVEILGRAAKLFEEQLDQKESALLVLSSALVPETIGNEELVTEIERLGRETEQWDEILGRYRDILEQLTEPADLLDLYRHAGRLFADELDQPDNAIWYYQNAYEIDPESIELVDRLESLYRTVANWPELAKVLHARVDLTPDPEEKVQNWRKLGEVYETQLGEIDSAVSAYEHILAIDEADLLAIESLERIYETYDRWEMLIDILRQKLNAIFDPEQLVEIRHRIALTYEHQLDSPERAIGAYNDLLTVDEGHRPSLEALERLYSNEENWHELLVVFDKQLTISFEPSEQVAIFGKMAHVHEEMFQDLEAAVDDHRQILNIDLENEAATQNLERLYYTLERWVDLVDMVERHIQLPVADETRIQLLNELARVHRDQLHDQHAAIDAFVRSLNISASQPDSLRELGSLYELTQNWEASVQVYEQLGMLLTDVDEQIGVYDHMGEIFEAQLMDDERAERAYLASLSLNPNHGPAIESLRYVYERRGDWMSIIHVYKQANDASRDLGEKAKYMAFIGRIYDERLDDLVSALRYYEQAQEFDPDVIEAAEPLIDVYMREQRYERALPLLEKVIGQYSGTQRTPEEYHLRYLQMAMACEHLGLDDRSLKSYHQAYEYSAGDLSTMLGLGRQLFSHGDLEAAFKIYQNVQIQHLEHLSGESACEVFYNAGQIKQRLGDKMRAIDYFEKVLEYDPAHKESINALLENYEQTNNWGRYIDLSQQLLAAETEPKLRFAKFSQIGDIYAKQLQDLGMAMQSYLQALDIEPMSVVVLRKLLDLYTKTRQWVEAIDMLQRLIELEPDPSKRAKFGYTVGVIYRDEVHSPQDAVNAFDQALDTDVSMLKAFEAIDRILTESKQWKELERAYRRMLKRVADHQDDPQMASLYMMLWKNLGEIYRSRLGHTKSAIQAFEMASQLNPDDEQLHLILAQLYELSDEAGAGVITQHRALIAKNPFRIESYRALFKAYIQAKEYDKAWCMASALSFLQSATDTEQKFYQQYLGTNLQAARGTLNIEMLRHVYHPEQDMLTTAIMQQLFVAFGGAYAKSLRDVGINKKKDVLDPNDKLLFCKIYSYAGARLAPVGLLPLPGLFLRRDQAIGIRNANVMPPSFIVGADMFQGKNERELAFIISKRLAWMLPQHYLGSCGYPTEWIKAFFMIALHISDPSLGLDRQIGPNAASLIEALQDAEQRSPGLMLNVQKLAKQFLSSGKNPNLSHWLTCVDHTTSRLGLLLCGDLHTAAAAIKNDPIPVGKASVKEKIRELVLFSISDEFFALRKQLGLAIGA